MIKLMPLIRFCSVLCLLALSSLAYSITIDNLRLWPAPDNTRLVFDLSGATKHNVFKLDNPNRLVIDINNSRFKKKFDQRKLQKTPITQLRVAERKKGMRFVLDLKSTVKFRSFTLPPNEQYGHRLVIDLYNYAKVKSPSQANITIDSLAKKNRDIIIAIDAGHGGEDPGASGPGRLREKTVVLKISKELKKLIDREPGYRAELVRTGDYFLSLRKRANTARAKKADLFLSIHADAFKSPQASGASVYALSQRGATSETGRYLAQRENRSDLIGGVGEVNLKDKEEQVAKLLLDLSMGATLEASLTLGDYLLKQMGKITKLHKKQVEQANFLVLKSPDLPSLLIESGFISNPKEARNLNSSRYQKKFANSLFQGIRNYYNQHPPAGTLVYKKVNSQPVSVTVKSGDTLSEIAERYNTTARALKKYNKLSSSKIRIGQRLKIPK